MAILQVKLNTGLIEGVPNENLDYTVFKGIPYAKPPVGELRWKAPVDHEPWEGVRKCDTFSPVAIQKNRTPGEFYAKEFFPENMPMSEDCLYLNVWTPSATASEKLPVMLWIHGGGYVQGYGHEMEFDGEAFCKRGVILVTINYRLGVLGFFAHPELSARSGNKVSGNYGILDQIQALKWVQQNIETFGGDPNNVTIFGQSAGGGAVQALISSTLTKGLFHKAIVQSAGGINTLGGKFTIAEAESFGAEVCNKTGKSLDELMNMQAEELREMVEKISSQRRVLAPNVDGYLLEDSPGNIIASGKHHDIPYLTGTVAGDGWLFGGLQAKNKKEFENAVRHVSGKYAKEYLKLFNVQSEEELQGVLSARDKAVSMLAPRGWARMHLKHGRKPIYIYYFNRNMPGGDNAGAFHSSELWYIFGTLNRCWRPMDAEDYMLSEVMTNYWTNFAKKGNPNGEGLPQWLAFTEEHPVTMELNEKKVEASCMGGDPILKGMEELLLRQVYEA